MSAPFDFDRLLSSTLEANGPQGVPSAAVEAALASSRDVSQRRPRLAALDRRAWPAHRFSLRVWSSVFPSRLIRVLILALVAAAVIALGIVGSALLKDQTPKLKASLFIRPFEYSIPADSAMRQSPVSSVAIRAWVQGPDSTPLSDLETLGGEGPHRGQVRGVVVGSGAEAWSHGNGGRFMLRTSPAEFLADLRDTANTPMDAITETTLDGRPALTAMLPGTGGSDIHVTGRMAGLGGTFVLITNPSRLIVADIDGVTVFVLIWSPTPADLATWMPVADEFVASIHFVPK